jgi:hypothetical protein
METMSTQTPDLRTAAQAVIDRWDTPKWKDAPATAGYIAALRDALAAEQTEPPLDMAGRWYMVARDGMAMLCVDREDAEAEARKADRASPRNGPHRAVQLGEAQATGLAKAYCHEDCIAYTAGIEKELQDAQAAARPTPTHLEAMERAWLWMENQADSQSKGGHATFDLMMLREERDALRAAIDAAPTTQPAPIESVLIDGIAYPTPAPVAAELLRLHIDARQPAPQQEAQEPVAWQSRTRPTWGGNDRPWSPWESCTKGLAEDCWKTPLLHDWAYEARALYTAPQPSPVAQGCALDVVLDAFENKTRGIPQAHIAAALVAELRAAIEAASTTPTAQVDALDTARLDWLLWMLPGDALRYVVGELADTADAAEFRAAIDAARAAQEGK